MIYILTDGFQRTDLGVLNVTKQNKILLTYKEWGAYGLMFTHVETVLDLKVTDKTEHVIYSLK
jgi:hypothetical protein